MSRDNEVAKTLGGWLGKAKKLGPPPEPTEVTGNLHRAERGRERDAEGLAQLNFKVSPRTKKRTKQLAVRDNITLLVMFDRMLELYEREYGKLGK